MRDYSNTFFCGIQATQWFADFLVWERFLNAHPAERIIELGTELGGFSLYLCLQAKQRGMEFYTFDYMDYPDGYPESFDLPLGQLLHIKDTFYGEDVLAEEGQSLIKGFITQRGKTVLYCDNGNKPREFEIYAPVLKTGDYIVVHDWEMEVHDSDIDYDLVEPVMEDWLIRFGSITRLFVKK